MPCDEVFLKVGGGYFGEGIKQNGLSGQASVEACWQVSVPLQRESKQKISVRRLQTSFSTRPELAILLGNDDWLQLQVLKVHHIKHNVKLVANAKDGKCKCRRGLHYKEEAATLSVHW
jgi:hypothetical protein